ncbi:MAG TPA: outer membrane lipoprotein chaperone LolA [Acidobacteriaceae bacterium]
MSLRTTLSCAAALLLAATLHAQDAHTLAQKVDAHYNHLQSFQAQYAEHYTGMGLNRTETGTLLLKKPGRMRWSYNQPAGKVFVLDGKSAYFYTPGDAQAQRIPAKQLDDLRSPLRFLLGHTQLEKELPGLTATSAGNGLFTLSGVPKTMEQRIHSLSLTVNADGIIQRIRLEETDGAVTDFTFTNIRENVPARDSDFVFTAPTGVQIVTGMPPI